MMFEIDRKDLQEADDFVHSGVLVKLMNAEGLSFGAMALILDAIFEKIDEVEEKFKDATL